LTTIYQTIRGGTSYIDDLKAIAAFSIDARFGVPTVTFLVSEPRYRILSRMVSTDTAPP
jgi:hypothetical protein